MSKTALTASAVLAAMLLIGVFLQSKGSSESVTESSISWHSFDEALTIAKRDNKKVLLDVYTDWCGWCKKMDSEVYTDKSVITALTASFVAVKLNAESSKPLTYQGRSFTEQSFAAGAGVTGYPATIFLDAGLAPITLVPGYIPADRFLPILKYIGEDHYRSISFEEYQQRGGKGDK
jgi:thioredoxin-related protein